MKKFTKSVFGMDVSAYNDSNVEWVVSGGCSCGLGCSMCSMRFQKRQFTMRQAMEFYAQICSKTRTQGSPEQTMHIIPLRAALNAKASDHSTQNEKMFALLNSLISPNSRIYENLFGPVRAKERVEIMSLITGVAKYPKAKAGANVVFTTLCDLAKVDQSKSHAGREAELVNWIRGFQTA